MIVLFELKSLYPQLSETLNFSKSGSSRKKQFPHSYKSRTNYTVGYLFEFTRASPVQKFSERSSTHRGISPIFGGRTSLRAGLVPTHGGEPAIRANNSRQRVVKSSRRTTRWRVVCELFVRPDTHIAAVSTHRTWVSCEKKGEQVLRHTFSTCCMRVAKKAWQL